MRGSHFLVIDLEATCADDRSIPRHEMEIIEVGAVMVEADTLKSVSEFQSFVKPIRNPRLSEFCRELTGIRQAEVDAADLFPVVLSRLLAWSESYTPYQFCSWGAYDERQFQQDCMIHRVAYPFGATHLNLKILFGERVGRRPMGLGTALRLVNIPFSGQAHRGIDDARNIVKLLPWIW